jgi:DnaJ-class molecular chaperone
VAFDPYSTLGVSAKATQDEIKSAYRKLAKKLHPDLNPGNKKAETQFKDVNKAYDLIGTPENRGKYDRGETTEQQEEAFRNHQSRRGRSRGGPFYQETQGDPGARYSTSFEGFDPSMFESLFGEEIFKGRRRSSRGDDQYYSMEIDFNTSILGGEKEITLPSGNRLRVKIPGGIREGQKLRLAGKGDPGDGGAPGDIYVEIKISPSKLFRRVGTDIEIDLPLSLSESILGAEVRVPTVDGYVLVKIPKGLSSGARVRIKGKGVPSSGGRGDQYVVVKIVMPEKIDPKLEEAIATWGKDHKYDPRAHWEKS